jgi:hypothetical protein
MAGKKFYPQQKIIPGNKSAVIIFGSYSGENVNNGKEAKTRTFPYYGR